MPIKLHPLAVRLNDSDVAVLERLKERTGLNVSGVIRLALRELDAHWATPRRDGQAPAVKEGGE